MASIPLVAMLGCARAERPGSSDAPAAQAASTGFTLAAQDGRGIAVTEWHPGGEPVGTILFSHGAGSAPDMYPGLIDVWASSGWQVLAPMHVDSRKHPHTADYPGLESWRTRIEDMRALSQHIGDTPYIAAGHSYGGLVALTLGGADAIRPEGVEGPLSDDKVSAVVAFSPPAPIPVLVTREGYAALSVPALIQTGTQDMLPGSGEPDADAWRGHLVPYEVAGPGNGRYGLVLEGVDHYFGGAICDYDQPGPPQTEQLETAAAVSRLFMLAHGLGDAAARTRLNARVSDNLPVMLLRK